MNLRSMVTNLFSNQKQPKEVTTFRMLNTYDNYFSKFDGPIYNDATVRTCIDVIARNIAKLRPTHIRRINGKVVKHQDALDSLLAHRPNEYMSAYDFLYKIVSQLYLYNNAFIYVKTDMNGNIRGLYPLDFTSIELVENNQKQLFLKFQFAGSNQVIAYEDIIHLRRNFATHEIFGDTASSLLREQVDVLLTLKQSIEAAVKNSSKIRGYLQVNGTMTPEDQEKNRDDFLQLIDKKSGIAVVDSKMSYNAITSDTKMADNEQLEFARQDLYRYFGVNEKILSGTFTEEEWIAFYESTIEPIALQMSQEFTAKLFTEREKGYGNEIVFESSRLEYASLKDKVGMVQVLQQSGIFTINEFREVFGFDPIEGGDTIIRKLDYTDTTEDTPTTPHVFPDVHKEDSPSITIGGEEI